MNNFINVRLQAYNHTKQLNILKHNTRKIKSLSERENSNNPNFVVIGEDLFDLEDEGTKDILYKSLKNIYNKDRIKHNEKVYNRRGRNLTNQQSTWLEGVFTFSEAIHSDLGNKYTKEELSKVANNCAQDLAKQLGVELRYLVLHMDETTPHFHFSIKNFDDNGHSIFHKIKHKEILSKIQDLAHSHFGTLGMDRGISKELTGKNYQNIQNYYKSKQIELKSIIQGLQEDIKQIQQAKKDIKNNFDLTSAEKKQELDKLDLEIKNFRGVVSEYKNIFNDYDIKIKAQKEEISIGNNTLNDLNTKLNIKTQEVNSFEQVVVKNKDIINNLINNNITKNIVKQDVVIDIDELKKDVNNLVNKTLKIDLKQKNLQEKDEQIKKLEDQNSILLDKLNEERNKNKVLTQDNISKTNKLSQLEENHKLEIKKLQNDFKQKLERRIKRLNLIIRLRRSNIANKVRNRLLKRKENFDLNR